MTERAENRDRNMQTDRKTGSGTEEQRQEGDGKTQKKRREEWTWGK